MVKRGTDTHVSRKPGRRWLLLIHRIPARPSYLRVKIWRHLQRLGAVPLKDSVYVLPATAEAREDLSWVLRDIVQGGGDGALAQASLLEGLSDAQVTSAFRAARDADYQRVEQEARRLLARRSATLPGLLGPITRLRRRVAEIAAIDFFHAARRTTVTKLLDELQRRAVAPAPRLDPRSSLSRPRGKVWVTRSDVHVDRIASAWLIRRFIDRAARFRFSPTRATRSSKDELRFDMFDGEFTHEGDLCTFEVLARRFGVTDPSVQSIAELVHDLDLKDARYGRPETAGLALAIDAIRAAHRGDPQRIERGRRLLDDLYELYRRR
jgi:hypothetical protein